MYTPITYFETMSPHAERAARLVREIELARNGSAARPTLRVVSSWPFVARRRRIALRTA